jgi:catechol 2,3-dioxygenase-like lactoylglutathione lyase family enzyme
MPGQSLFLKIDCLRLPVPDLDAALEFYRDRLGHALIWRSGTAAGLRLSDSNAELVLQIERPEVETDLMVESVEAGVERFVAARRAPSPRAIRYPNRTLRRGGRSISQRPGRAGPEQWAVADEPRRRRDRE